MRFDILNLGGGGILAGALLGRRVLGELVKGVSDSGRPEVIFLDFEGVEVATASFLREAVVGFRDFIRSRLPNIYVVIANASPGVEEELHEFLLERADGILTCKLKDGASADVRLIGRLDARQMETFNLVRTERQVSAPALASKFPEEGVGATAWNNRLAALASKGLIIERQRGRSKTYSPVLGDV